MIKQPFLKPILAMSSRRNIVASNTPPTPKLAKTPSKDQLTALIGRIDAAATLALHGVKENGC